MGRKGKFFLTVKIQERGERWGEGEIGREGKELGREKERKREKEGR